MSDTNGGADEMTVEQTINRSFLARVPEMMAANPSLTIAQAVRIAYYDEEKLMLDLMDGDSERVRFIRRELSNRAYDGIKART